MKKLLFGIFICFSLVFVMSHNVGAVESVFDINNYDLIENFETQPLNCSYNGSNSTIGYGYCVLGGTYYQLNSITFNPRAYRTGDLVEFDIVTYGNSQSFTNGETVSGSLTNPLDFPFIYTSVDYGVLSITPIQFENTNQILNMYQDIICRPFGASSTECINYPEITIGYKYFQAWRVVLKIKRDLLSYPLSLSGSSSLPIFDLTGYNLPNNFLYIRVSRFNKWRPIQTKEEEAAEKEIESSENIENQTPPSSNETGDGAEATNLISAFSGFVSALGGLSATNCNLTLNFPEFAGGSRVVNVCQNKDKAGNIISVFSSLTLIIFYVPLAIRLLTMIYNEIRSFTNG